MKLNIATNEDVVDTSYLWEESQIFVDIDESQNKSSTDYKNEQHDHDEYMAHLWPMPAIHENKMVYQLDEVTKESEEKASEIFDIVEEVSNELMNSEESIGGFIDVLNGNVELFKALSEKFPDVIAFKVKLEQNDSALKAADRDFICCAKCRLRNDECYGHNAVSRYPSSKNREGDKCYEIVIRLYE